MVKSYHYLLMCTLLLCACAEQPEDNFLTPVRADSYQLNNYSGPRDFVLDVSYLIENSQIQEVNLSSNDGNSSASIYAVFVGDRSKINSNKILLYCHDKSGNIDFYWSRIQLLAKLGLDGYGIMIVDYRGFGKSSGSSSENSLYADIDAAIRWLVDEGLTDDRLILYGYGIGTGVVTELTRHPRTLSPAKIILEAPLASIEALIQETLLLSVPASYLTGWSMDNVSNIKAVNTPLLWLHGSADDVFSMTKQGELVFNAHPGTENVSKFASRVAGANHYDIPVKFLNGYDGYLLQLQSFLSLP